MAVLLLCLNSFETQPLPISNKEFDNILTSTLLSYWLSLTFLNCVYRHLPSSREHRATLTAQASRERHTLSHFFGHMHHLNDLLLIEQTFFVCTVLSITCVHQFADHRTKFLKQSCCLVITSHGVLTQWSFWLQLSNRVPFQCNAPRITVSIQKVRAPLPEILRTDYFCSPLIHFPRKSSSSIMNLTHITVSCVPTRTFFCVLFFERPTTPLDSQDCLSKTCLKNA